MTVVLSLKSLMIRFINATFILGPIIRNENNREELKIDQITEWIINRKDEWNEQVSPMDNRLVKIVRNRILIDTRSISSPKHR